jgi:outer membrane receptor for monomeric catechols
MPARMLRTVTIAVVAICYSDGVFAAESGGQRHTSAPIHGSASSSRSDGTLKAPLHATRWKQKAVRRLAADRDPYADPAAPYKADRLSSPRESQPILNIPGQVTVLTRQVLDDKNATTLKDALSTTAGVTVGR